MRQPTPASSRSRPSGLARPKDSWLAGEIIPDSEEERMRSRSEPDVIEISSDEEDETKGRYSTGIPFQGTMPGAWAESPNVPKVGSSTKVAASTPRRNCRARQIIWSSDSESGGSGEANEKTAVVQEIIDLCSDSESSHEEDQFRKKTPPRKQRSAVSTESLSSNDDEDAWNRESSVLVLDEPKSARRPVHKASATPRRSRKLPAHVSISNGSGNDFNGKAPGRSLGAPSTQTSTSTETPQTTKGTRRKKAVVEAERRQLEAYAQQIFAELNTAVFKDGLPRDTKLNWNKRLLTTAGRAKWHRNRSGVEATEIELAVKILDCEERVRNTLSHEMCHLATWVIDGDLQEAHGSLFKAWANKVMRKRPEIEITTRHNYDIAHPYRWQCDTCRKIYGRHSKSINPDIHGCGSCKGLLVPLFAQRIPKTPKTVKTSQMASTKPLDSPRSILHPKTTQFDGLQRSPPKAPPPPDLLEDDLYDSDPEYDLESLTHEIGAIALETL